MSNYLKIWYIAPQRLCNFNCEYCVSTGDYTKSNKINWKNSKDLNDFKTVIKWIISRPNQVRLRLGSLGEPLASHDFLDQVILLTNQKNIEFVELLTNGSLLKQRLPILEEKGVDFKKISLWVSYHPDEMTLEKFISNVKFAIEEYDCSVIINGLAFSKSMNQVRELKEQADKHNIEFNLDFGYDPKVPAASFSDKDIGKIIPVFEGCSNTEDLIEDLIDLGANRHLLNTNIIALTDLKGQECSAGNNYICITINGDVYPCSRYSMIKKDKIGNILEDGDVINLFTKKWSLCKAGSGCCNKEDFLNLKIAKDYVDIEKQSIGRCKK